VSAALISGRIYSGIKNCEQGFCENIFSDSKVITKLHFRLYLPSYFVFRHCAFLVLRAYKLMPGKSDLLYNAPLFEVRGHIASGSRLAALRTIHGRHRDSCATDADEGIRSATE
jgi:hypothetical protein